MYEKTILTKDDAETDAGLRSYLASIYNWMALGIAVTALTAYLSAVTGFTAYLATGGFLFWVVLLAPFILIFVMGVGLNSGTSISTMATAFLTLTAMFGATLSITIHRYTGVNIAMAFFATMVVFCGMSLWAYTTKRVLSGLGSVLYMSLLGLLVVMIIGAVVKSTLLTMAISFGGVVLFSILVAYDTQEMKNAYRHGDADHNSRMALWAALDLYLDFANLFIRLLQLLGFLSSSKD